MTPTQIDEITHTIGRAQSADEPSRKDRAICALVDLLRATLTVGDYGECADEDSVAGDEDARTVVRSVFGTGACLISQPELDRQAIAANVAPTLVEPRHTSKCNNTPGTGCICGVPNTNASSAKTPNRGSLLDQLRKPGSPHTAIENDLINACSVGPATPDLVALERRIGFDDQGRACSVSLVAVHRYIVALVQTYNRMRLEYDELRRDVEAARRLFGAVK